jgi:hypothetical protein
MKVRMLVPKQHPNELGSFPKPTDGEWMRCLDVTEYDRSVRAYVLTHFMSWQSNMEELKNEHASNAASSDTSRRVVSKARRAR